MKKGWEYKTLGECCEKINGLWKGKKEPFINVGVIRNANFTKDMTLDFSNIEYLDVEVKQFNSRKLRKGDLIIEKSGGSEKQPVGRAVLFLKDDGNYSFSNFTSVLRIINNEELLYEFLYKYLLFIYRRGDTRSMQKATTGIHNIEFEKYLDIQVPIMPLAEQRRIVSYLDSSFALIDKIKENASKSLSEAKALFQSALAEAMEPKEGWEEKTLGEIANVFAGGDVPKDRMSKCKKEPFIIPIYTNGTDNEGLYGYTDKARVNNDSLTISARGTIGAVFKRNHPFFPAIRLITVSPKNFVDINFLFYVLLNSKFSNSGTTIPQLTVPMLKEYSFSIPGNKLIQHNITNYLDSLTSKVRAIEEKYQKMIAECDAMKQAMLREVFE